MSPAVFLTGYTRARDNRLYIKLKADTKPVTYLQLAPLHFVRRALRIVPDATFPNAMRVLSADRFFVLPQSAFSSYHHPVCNELRRGYDTRNVFGGRFPFVLLVPTSLNFPRCSLTMTHGPVIYRRQRKAPPPKVPLTNPTVRHRARSCQNATRPLWTRRGNWNSWNSHQRA